jgi:cell wall-associated NlpC family hydrolase
MRKWNKAILYLAVLNLSVSLPISYSYADVVDNSKVIENTSINKESSLISNNIVEKICINSGATILENSGNWYKISINGNSGWVHKEIFPVESIKAAQAKKETDKTETLAVNSQDLSAQKEQKETVDKTENVSNAEKTESKETTDKAENKTDSQADKTETVAALKKGSVNGNDVNIRKGPGKDYDVICQVNKGDKVEILSSKPEWLQIKTSNGVVGWIYSTYVSMGTTLASRGETSDSNVSDIRAAVVEYAKKYLGVRYVYGGSSPSGFDCSGFTCYVFKHFGINLNRSAYDQSFNGTKISKSQLKPGDLVFFDTNGGMNKINHAGIYIGNGSFIHASSGSSKKKVVISDINSGFYNGCFMKATRVLE